MTRARNVGDDQMGGSRWDADETTTKVVLMELACASGPLSAAAIGERTLLSTDTVESALHELAEADLCTVHPGDERRPRRYEKAIEVEQKA